MTSGKTLASGAISSARAETTSPEGDFVLDFLYHDARRVGSFLAQFEQHGLLQSKKLSSSAAESEATKTGLNGAVNVVAVRGTASTDTTTSSEERESFEAVYDPLWRNARRFMDIAESRDLLVKDARQARIGQFVAVRGKLSIFDMGLIQKIWGLRAFQSIAAKSYQEQNGAPGNRQERRANKKSGHPSGASEVDAIFQLLEVMPHKVIASLAGPGDHLWATLDAGCLITAPAELALKHGIVLQGEWTIVGIVDALPLRAGDATSDFFEQAVSIKKLGSLGEVMAGFGPLIRQMLGRPEDAMGVTPLMVMRSVEPR